MSIQTLARTAINNMVQKTRDDGSKFFCFKDDAPDWMTDLSRAAHDGGNVSPNDWHYQFIFEALDALANQDDVDDARLSIEADIYISDLTDWLGSQNSRYSYVDQAIEEMGKGDSVIQDLQNGQLLEKLEVFEAIAGFLNEMADNEEESA
jgi:hypothetical protein